MVYETSHNERCIQFKLPYGDAAWEAIPGDKDKEYGVVRRFNFLSDAR
jgi:hypothetical protein